MLCGRKLFSMLPGMLDSFRVPQGSVSQQGLPRQDPTLTRDGNALSGGYIGALSEVYLGEKI